MRLLPIPPGSRVRLRNREAAVAPGPMPTDIKKATEDMLEVLRKLQAALYAESKRALLVVLQGRDASGKDGTVTHVCSAFNPAGCTVSSFKQPSAVELAHDYLWRVHRVTPARGMVGVFNRSQYEDVLAVRVHQLQPRSVWSKRYAQINAFEQMLTASGTVIIKLFLHVSKAEQRHRLLERTRDPLKNWKISASDLADRERWDDYTLAYQDMLSRCSTPWAPWYVVPADDKATRNYLVSGVILAVLRRMAPQFPRVNSRLLARYRRELGS
jgi:PPK2 family polyphosphate:nucleotide phosphotransferase